jgi:hypothetical protein
VCAVDGPAGDARAPKARQVGVRARHHELPPSKGLTARKSTKTARYRYTRREGQFHWHNMHGNSIHKSTSSW